jgi:hypothetical protein
VLSDNGRYEAFAPELADDTGSLLRRLRDSAGDGACVFAGFDFPIGLPARYAQAAGIVDFPGLLLRLGSDEWKDFCTVAEHPEQIGLYRPFYPRVARRGSARAHLINGLGLESWSDLYRSCERVQPERRAASPLFWTLGAQQVGKAAISGWRDMLRPAMSDGSLDVRIWPFSGRLAELLRPGRIVIAETYPAEFYRHLGIGMRKKSDREERARNAPGLARWAAESDIGLADGLTRELGLGFANDDAFDAVIGLFGMLNVVLGQRPVGEPDDHELRTVEGWMLGQVGPK